METGSVCFASERQQDPGLVADEVEGRGWRAMLAVCVRPLAPYSALMPVYHIDRPASTTQHHERGALSKSECTTAPETGANRQNGRVLTRRGYSPALPLSQGFVCAIWGVSRIKGGGYRHL